MVVKWIVCFWCCPAGCILMFFCFVTYALSYFSSTAHCRLKLNFFFCAFLWQTACCESAPPPTHPKPRARKPLKVQDLSSLTSCVVLCLCPKANTLSSIFFFSRTHFSQSHCMCSVVVVEAMVASTVTSVQPGHDNLFCFFFFWSCIFQNKVPGCVTLWVLPWSQDPKQCHSILYNPNFSTKKSKKKRCVFIYIPI